MSPEQAECQGRRRALGHLFARASSSSRWSPAGSRSRAIRRSAWPSSKKASFRAIRGSSTPRSPPSSAASSSSAWRKPKEARFQTAVELGRELEALEKGFPTPERALVAKRPTSTREVTIKFEPKRLVVPALGIILVATAVIFGGRLFRREPAREPRLTPGAPTVSDTGSGSKWGFLAPLFGDAVRSLDPEDLKTLERAISSIQKKTPETQPLDDLWNNVQKRFTDGLKEQAAGNLDASRKSYTRSQSEMNRFLSLVKDKDAADGARGELQYVRGRADAAAAAKGDNILHWIAAEKLKDAEEAYRKNDFAGARILYSILARVFALGIDGGDEEACLARLNDLVGRIRKEAEAIRKAAPDSWLFDRAREEEAIAAAALAGKRYAEAAEYLVLSAFLYEKAKDVSLEIPGAGG